jgi:hypothetical protein
MKRNRMRPVPPGEILNEKFLKPLGRPREGDRGSESRDHPGQHSH